MADDTKSNNSGSGHDDSWIMEFEGDGLGSDRHHGDVDAMSDSNPHQTHPVSSTDAALAKLANKLDFVMASMERIASAMERQNQARDAVETRDSVMRHGLVTAVHVPAGVPAASARPASSLGSGLGSLFHLNSRSSSFWIVGDGTYPPMIATVGKV